MFKLIGVLLALLSTSCLRRLGSWFGWLAFSVLRIRRAVTTDNICRALSVPREEAATLARQVYSHLCTGALEFLLIGRLKPRHAEKILGRRGVERLESVLGQGKGMLVLSAHLGNWDLLACCGALCGLKVNVVTRSIKATWLNKIWMNERRSCGVNLLEARGSATKIRSALKRNEVVAMVLDQHEPSGLSTPFFGRPAATSTALARLARAMRAPVVPAFLIRTMSGFRLEVQEPLDLARTDDPNVDIAVNTAVFNRIIEEQVRENPEQWLWLHRRWKLD